MRSRRSRAKALIIAVALIMLALPVASASAIVESSQITTPAGVSYPLVEEHSKITIAGTATGMTKVEIRCYSGNEENSYNVVAEEVPVVGGEFSVEAQATRFPAEVCQLRAVPEKALLKLPPGEKEPFEGPIVVASKFIPETGNYFAASSTLAGSFDFESAGTFALESSLYSASGHDDAEIFFGESDLDAYPPIETRSTLQVDGTNAYVPYAASEVEERLREEAEEKKTAFTPLTGKPSVILRKEFNGSTHQFSIEEEDPVVKCSPEVAYPPTLTSCTGFVSTGVKLDRTWQSSDEDHVASMNDAWVSTDGAAHAVNARYFEEMASTKEGGVYEFPGEAAFSATKTGETKTLPAGPGTILYKTAPSLSELGNGEDPQGAIVYDSAPSEPVKVASASSGHVLNVFEMPYQRTIPAGGSSSPLRMTFIQAFALAEVKPLAEAAIAGYHPTVTITSPANGATVTTPSVTVTGTAKDTGALSSLTVNGAAVAIGAGGTWTTTTALKAGANTITATATDQAGLTSSSAITVTYAPPKPTPKPAPATASQVGSASGSNGQASVTLACHGATGTKCKIHVQLTTVEKTRHGHLIGLAATKTHYKRVTIATLTVVIPAGQQVKVALKLNSIGRRLLAHFGKVPAHLTAILEGEGRRSTVIAQNLTIKPKPKKHKKH